LTNWIFSRVADLCQILYLFRAWENCDTAASFGASLWQSDNSFLFSHFLLQIKEQALEGWGKKKSLLSTHQGYNYLGLVLLMFAKLNWTDNNISLEFELLMDLVKVKKSCWVSI